MAKSTQTRHVFFWCGGLLTLLILLFVAWQHSKASALKHHLLENYKAAIDYSAIVSKSDAQGIITYANDAFCKISGYTHDELLNQPHSLVRHPDTDREVFQAMWQTLKAGQKWQGVLKNQKKDGTPYWVDISIVPIFNNKGALEEYIAIRKDVTQIVLLNEEIKETQSELINRLGEAVESRSKETGYHIQRVAHYSRHLACLAGLSQDECEHIFSASTMHDVGKITIPDAILLKEGKLESDEWEVMKTHAETGYKILAGSNRPLLKMAADIAHEHHEHFNGLGYPRGLKGEAISIHGRIVAITDVFDALATERIYKKAWPLEQILEHIKQQSGQQFDPELIALFLDNIDDFMRIKDNFKNE